MDKEEQIKDFFKDKGVDLSQVKGLENGSNIFQGLNKQDALKALNLYQELGIPILGGDVLCIKNDGSIEYTSDSWHVDILENESCSQFLKKSVSESYSYISKYAPSSLRENSILFDIVPDLKI